MRLLQSAAVATVPSAGIGANSVRSTLHIDEQMVKVIA